MADIPAGAGVLVDNNDIETSELAQYGKEHILTIIIL